VRDCGASCLPTVLGLLTKFKARAEARVELKIPGLRRFPNRLPKIEEETFQEAFDLKDIESVLNSIIQDHAPQGHTSEVAWAIGGCILFDLRIRIASVKGIVAMEDPTVSLLGLHAREMSLLPKNVTLAELQRFMTTDDLYDQQWLLAYEANVKGWLPSLASSPERLRVLFAARNHSVTPVL
jgi:hypothetical protein